jgi:hypothetical protein
MSVAKNVRRSINCTDIEQKRWPMSHLHVSRLFHPYSMQTFALMKPGRHFSRPKGVVNTLYFSFTVFGFYRRRHIRMQLYRVSLSLAMIRQPIHVLPRDVFRAYDTGPTELR